SGAWAWRSTPRRTGSPRCTASANTSGRGGGRTRATAAAPPFPTAAPPFGSRGWRCGTRAAGRRRSPGSTPDSTASWRSPGPAEPGRPPSSPRSSARCRPMPQCMAGSRASRRTAWGGRRNRRACSPPPLGRNSGCTARIPTPPSPSWGSPGSPRPPSRNSAPANSGGCPWPARWPAATPARACWCATSRPRTSTATPPSAAPARSCGAPAPPETPSPSVPAGAARDRGARRGADAGPDGDAAGPRGPAAGETAGPPPTPPGPARDGRLRLGALLRSRGGLWAGAVGLSVLATALGLALTALSGWLIVRASVEEYIMYLLVAIVGVRAFGIGRSVATYAEQLLTHHAAFQTIDDLRLRLWRAIAARGAGSRRLLEGGAPL